MHITTHLLAKATQKDSRILTFMTGRVFSKEKWERGTGVVLRIKGRAFLWKRVLEKCRLFCRELRRNTDYKNQQG